MFVIVIFLVTYVVPQVASVFVNTKRSLPFLTVAMMATSDFVRHWGWLMALGGVGAVSGFLFAFQQRLGVLFLFFKIHFETLQLIVERHGSEYKKIK